MPPLLNYLVAVSIVGVLCVLFILARKSGAWGAFTAEFAVLLGFVVLLDRLFGFPFQTSVASKGPGHELPVAGALYVVMLAGMLAQHLYARFEKPRRRRGKFDFGVFVAPIFASPIVFIPLLVAMQNADIDLTKLTAPRLMVFCVAFQNGFFWKEFFDHKRREA